MLSEAKRRAKKSGVPFALTPEDITIPEVCPALGLPLEQSRGEAAPCSPSLDRIIPELGYVPGNVCVISYRANTLKRDATWDELKKLSRFMERQNYG